MLTAATWLPWGPTPAPRTSTSRSCANCRYVDDAFRSACVGELNADRRTIQIERKLAPFWRGLNDLDSQWTEHQIITAARGLPIPPADQPPPEELIPRPLPVESPAGSSQNLNNLTVPIGDRSLSVASDHSASNAGSGLPSPVGNQPARTNSRRSSRGARPLPLFWVEGLEQLDHGDRAPGDQHAQRSLCEWAAA